MSGFSRASAALSVTLLSTVIASCGAETKTDSELNTVVGRGGALFDKRVQVINALPNLVAGTTCLYVSEYDKSKAPLFSGDSALTSDQKEFLRQAERDARPVTLFPVSITDLDRGLAQKDVERKTRGILLIPTGIVAAYLGFLPLAIGIAWSGSVAGIITSPLALPYIAGMLGGFGLINQSTRDLHSKNSGLRLGDATANSSATPARSNLGVTIAYMNVAKSLPAASNQPCPSNLTSESVQPYFQSIMEQHNALSDTDLSKATNDALAQLKNIEGCHFSANVGDEKLVYHALPTNADSSSLRLQTYRIAPSVGTQLISDEDLNLQLKSDARAGRKYITDNERGSIAIWLSEASKDKPMAAKLAHELPSGEYVGQKTQISGTCRL